MDRCIYSDLIKEEHLLHGQVQGEQKRNGKYDNQGVCAVEGTHCAQ